MSNLKDEFEQIEVPSELRARARAGIERAAQEQKPKKQIVPTVVTTIVTAAVVLFTFGALLKPTMFSSFTGAATSTSEGANGLATEYVIAFIATLVAAAIAFVVVKKQYFQAKWVWLTLAVFLVWNWNIAVYKATELNEPVVMPIYFETLLDRTDTLFVNYLVNKEDAKTYLHSLSIDGEVLVSTNLERFGDGEIQQYDRLARHVSKQATFEIDRYTWVYLEGKDVSKATAQFSDGTSVAVKLENFAFLTDGNGTPLSRESTETWQAGTVDNTGGSVQYGLAQDERIEEVRFSWAEGLAIGYELRSNGVVIERFNYGDLPNMSSLPYDAEENSTLHLAYSLTRQPDNVTTYILTPLIRTNETIYTDTIHLHNPVTQQQVRYILQEVK